jgi:hypothetical protein
MYTTPCARLCISTCPPRIRLGSVSPFRSFTKVATLPSKPDPATKLNIMCACGIASSARMARAVLFCHSSDRSVAVARRRISRRVAYPVASHAGNARCVASMAARQSSEDAAAAVEAREPVYGLRVEKVAPVLAGRCSPLIRRWAKGTLDMLELVGPSCLSL